MKLLRKFDSTMERYAPISYLFVMLVAIACAGLVKLGWLSGPLGMAANIALFGYAAFGIFRSRSR